MKDNFPGIKVYATFGNHDYYPSNMFPPHGNGIYNDTYVIWEEWINETSQVDNFLKGIIWKRVFYMFNCKFGTCVG